MPDSQTTIADATGIAAFVHALVRWLAARGASERIAPTWRIEENRWSAARYGVEGQMADLATGDREPTRARPRRLLDEIGASTDARDPLEEAHRLVDRNGAIRQRELVADDGVRGLTVWLADHFLDGA